MPAFEVPAYMKPRSRIASWIIPLVYVSEVNGEYISELRNVALFLQEKTKMYPQYQLMTMRKDMRGNPEAFKVFPEKNEFVTVPLEELVRIASRDIEIAKIKGSFHLLTETGTKFVEEVYNSLDKDVRTQINVPTQWVVWIPDKKILTRLCWVLALEGEITIRPWGSSNIMLEATNVTFDAVNSVSIKKLKANNLQKERLNDHWRTLLATEELAEAAEGFGLEEYAKQETETAEEAVGKVE